MNNEAIFDKVTGVLRHVLGDETINAFPQMTAKDVENWDSFGHIRIVLGVEKEFGIKFATSEISKFKNVGQLVDMIAEKTTAST